MIEILIATAAPIVIVLLFRYVPGFKCISFCRYKQLKLKRAVDKLRERLVHDYNQSRVKVQDIRLEDLSTKQMLALYKATEPFGCATFRTDSWVYEAREILKNRIADREILES